MSNETTIPLHLANINDNVAAITRALVGKLVRVKLTSNFNGQPYGHSRKKLAGQTFIVEQVFVEAQGRNGATVALWFGGDFRASIGLDEVDAVDVEGRL